MISDRYISRISKLDILLFIAIYSNVLRPFLGRWVTLVSDIVLISLTLGCFYKNGRWVIRVNKKMKNILLFLLLLQMLAVAEIFNSNITNFTYALIEYRKSIFQIFALMVGYYYLQCGTFSRILRNIELLTMPVILYGLKQYYLYSSFDSKFYSLQDAGQATYFFGTTRRAISFLSGPFHYGMMCALVLSISMYLYFISKKKGHLICVSICLLGTYCSGTRTNFLSSLVVIAIYGVYFFLSKNTVTILFKKMLLITSVIIIFAYFIFAFSDLLASGNSIAALLNTLFNMSEDSRFMGRISTWQHAIPLIKAHPILGNGMGAAADTMASHSVAIQSVTSHNMFIKIAVEMGVLGLVLFVIFFTRCISESLKNKDKPRFWFTVSFITVVLINSLVGSTISTFPIMTIIWLLIGASIRENENTKFLEKIKYDEA